jgi:hypothetical protein
MGMQPTDIGIIADADECFTRDFFRAVQYCEDIEPLDYKEKGQCRHDVTGIRSATFIYESSPERPTEKRIGDRPGLFPVHCIEGIGNSTLHLHAPRQPNSINRAHGWGYLRD